MKLGFLTACMPERSLEQIVPWAAEAGFEALEVAAWPALGSRPFTASHLPMPGPDGGGLAVEHEDPVWGGTPDRVETGLRIAHQTLRPLIIA